MAEVWRLGCHCPSETWRGVAGFFSGASSEGLSVSHSKHLSLCQENDCQWKRRALSEWRKASKHWPGPNLRDKFKIFFSKVKCLPGSPCDVSYGQTDFPMFVILQIITRYLAVTVIPYHHPIWQRRMGDTCHRFHSPRAAFLHRDSFA